MFSEQDNTDERNAEYKIVQETYIDVAAAPASTTSFKEVFSECWEQMQSHKALAMLFAFLVNNLELLQKAGNYLFYALPVCIVPCLIFCFKQLLHNARFSQKGTREHDKLIGFTTYLLISLIIWSCGFAARAINGNLFESAQRQAVGQLRAKIDELAVSQQKTEEKLSGMEEEMKQRKESVVRTAEENIAEAKAFLNRESDSKYIDDHTYQTILSNCNESLNALPDKYREQRAGLMLNMAKVYYLWAGKDSKYTVSRYESALGLLSKVIAMENISEDKTAEAYVFNGNIYMSMDNIRSKEENLREAEKAFESGKKYLKHADNETQALFYFGVGALKISQSQRLKKDQREEKKQLIAAAQKDFAKANNKLLDTENSLQTADYIGVFNGMFDVLFSIFTQDGTEAQKKISNTIGDIDKNIQALDLETEQKKYVELSYWRAIAYLKLSDMYFNCLMNLLDSDSDLEPDTNIKKLVADTFQAMLDAEESIQHAIDFNGDGEYVEQGELYYTRAMALFRQGEFLRLTTSKYYEERKSLYDEALSQLDAALQSYPVKDHLRDNIKTIKAKVQVLLTYGITCDNEEKVEEAYDLSANYLKNYSNMMDEDTRKAFESVANTADKWLSEYWGFYETVAKVREVVAAMAEEEDSTDEIDSDLEEELNTIFENKKQ